MSYGMLKRQRQSEDGGIGEETQREENPDSRESITTNLDSLFKEFQLERGYPSEKLNWLVCPVFKLHPEKYKCKVASCQGWGFKTYKEFNEHIERTHKPLELEDPKKRDSAKNQVPRIDNSEAYRTWDQQLRSRRRAGTKMTPEYLRQKWWNTARALELVGVLPSPLPEDEHLAFPGPELNTLHLFGKWLPQRGLTLIGKCAGTSDVTSMSAAKLDAKLPTIVGTVAGNEFDNVLPEARMTAAEKLNDRPKAEKVYYEAPPGDSGYHSQGINDDFIDEETAYIADGYPDDTLATYSVMENALRGTGSKLPEPPIDLDEHWEWEWGLDVDDDDREEDFLSLA